MIFTSDIQMGRSDAAGHLLYHLLIMDGHRQETKSGTEVDHTPD